jgi:predicted AlkP superfamily pyrophosphatase or phosphodiesterase
MIRLQLLACALLATTCLNDQAVVAASSPVQHVLVVGCDGLGSLAIGADNMPVVHRLMREGAWTLRARGVMPTSSSPNWASMIMGAGPEQHGITSNDWATNKFEIPPTVTNSAGFFPTIFSVLREQRPNARIACLYDWDGFGKLLEVSAPNILENVKGTPNTARRACEVIIKEKPTFLFLQFDEIDHAGHSHGYGSPEYLKTVDEIDTLIGSLLDALEKAGIRDQTIVIVTADHGGKDKGHGGATKGEIEIPWIVTGPGIRRGHPISANVDIYDTAATIAHIFRLNRPPAWIGKPILEVFEQGRR